MDSLGTHKTRSKGGGIFTSTIFSSGIGVGSLASSTTTVKKLAVSIKNGIKVIITSKKGVRFNSSSASSSLILFLPDMDWLRPEFKAIAGSAGTRTDRK